MEKKDLDLIRFRNCDCGGIVDEGSIVHAIDCRHWAEYCGIINDSTDKNNPRERQLAHILFTERKI